MRGFYRWHLQDPICFEEDLRVTIQQIGVGYRGLFERQDDVASVAYWYQTLPHAPFQPLMSKRIDGPDKRVVEIEKQVFCGVFALALGVTGCGVQKKEAASDIVPENRQELTILHVDAGTEGFDSFISQAEKILE